MDVPRAPRRRRRVLVVLALLAAIALTVLLSRLEPASPVVHRDLLVLAEVGRGRLPLEIRAWGRLASDQLQSIEATVNGRVVVIGAGPGQTVPAGALLVELASPELALDAAKAEQEHTAAQAGFLALRRSLGTQRLEREAKLADMRSAREASRDLLADLHRRAARGESVELEAVAARDAFRSLEERIRVEAEVLALLESTGREQIALETRRLVALGEVVVRERARVEALRVRAPVDAVVEELRVEAGQWVTPGTVLLRLLRPERMVAELSVPGPLAARVRPGQEVELVDATGDTIMGTVGTIASAGRVAPPAVARDERDPPHARAAHESAHRGVTVRLGSVPRAAAAADAGVEGTIRIGTVEDALSLKRPAWAVEGGAGFVFRVAPDYASAERVKVRFGLGSHDRIQILSGLREGDAVIVSDMSRFEDVPCVRLKP
jgi:HlyD family secretion protein